MKQPSFKNIKTRKEHNCNYCGMTIGKGENAQVMKARIPKFEGENQVGIEYVRIYLHDDDFMCWTKFN